MLWWFLESISNLGFYLIYIYHFITYNFKNYIIKTIFRFTYCSYNNNTNAFNPKQDLKHDSLYYIVQVMCVHYTRSWRRRNHNWGRCFLWRPHLASVFTAAKEKFRRYICTTTSSSSGLAFQRITVSLLAFSRFANLGLYISI